MILGFFCFLAANAAVLLGTRAILEKVRPNDASLNHLTFLLVRLLLISLIVLLFGSVRGLSGSVLGVAGMVLLPFLLRRHPLKLPKRVTWLAIGMGVIAAKLLAQAWIFAPIHDDVLSYHLPKVAEWIQAGGFTSELGTHTHVTFPAGFELVEAWWVLFFHHDVLIEAAGLEFLLLGASAVRVLGERLGLSERAASWAGLACATIPGLHAQAISCFNDGPVAALVLSTAAFACARAPYAWWVVPLGLGAGVKPTYLYAIPGLLLLGWWFRREPRIEPKDSRVLQWAAVASAVVGLFWYARNTVLYGNPIHPVGWSGLVDARGGRWIQFGPDASSLLGNLRSLFGEHLWDIGGPVAASLRGGAGWGALAVCAGLPSLGVLLFREPSFRRLSLAFALSLVCVLGLVLHDPWCSRFVLFIPALLVLAACRVADRVPWARIAVGAALIVQVAVSWRPAELTSDVAAALARQSWRQRSASFLYDLDLPVEKVGLLAGSRAPAYLFYGPAYSRRVVYLRPDSPEALKEALDREGLRLVYAWPSGAHQADLLAEAERKGWLSPLRDRLYRVP